MIFIHLLALLAAEFQLLPGMQARSELLSRAADMQAAVEASRRHLAPWDAKQYALKVSLYTFSLASCMQHHVIMQAHLLHVSHRHVFLAMVDNLLRT